MQRVRTMAAEQGLSADPGHPDTLRRLEMGVFPQGAQIIANPYNKIPGFSVGDVHFVPGFPVMAHPMIESLLDGRYAHLHGMHAQAERSVIVFGTMEATLTPLMVELEARFAGIKVFSLPSVDHPQWGRHIELGLKGDTAQVEAAYPQLLSGLHAHGATLGPELVR
jgi:molybdopterin-biosynthesis enzyme MoeA-like protein